MRVAPKTAVEMQSSFSTGQIMKTFILIITVALLAASQPMQAVEHPLLARVTVYWASGGKGSDPYTRHHQAATGCRLHDGHCAVDPRHIPYGSKVMLADGSTLAAVDTGTAVKNRKAARESGHTPNERNAIVIDRFFETKHQALTWAARHPLFMPVKVLAPNTRMSAATNANTSLVASATRVTRTVTVQQPVRAKYALLATDGVSHSRLNRFGR
jgi:hypothetical protein